MSRYSYVYHVLSAQFYIADGTNTYPQANEIKRDFQKAVVLLFRVRFIRITCGNSFCFLCCTLQMLMTYCCQVRTFDNKITREECGVLIPNLKNESGRRLHLETQPSPSPSQHWIWVLLGLDAGSTAFPISYVVIGLCLFNFWVGVYR